MTIAGLKDEEEDRGEDRLNFQGCAGGHVEFSADNSMFAVEVEQEIWVARLGPAQVIYRTATASHQPAFMSFAPTGGLLAFMGKIAVHLHQVTGKAAGEVCCMTTCLHACTYSNTRPLESYLGLGWTHCALLVAGSRDWGEGVNICLLSFAPK